MSINITYFVNGTTTDDLKSISSGWSDVDLADIGVKQNEELREQIKDKKYDVVFCSDLKRSYKTAELVFKGKCPLIKDRRLRECNYGKYNATSSLNIETQKLDAVNNKFPDGESYEGVKMRIAEFIAFLKTNYDGKNVAIVAHKAPQLCLDVLLKNKTWEQAFADDWRKKKAWQPGWDYLVK
jgi:broad specificity phosphatase PhoE